jgi:TonB-dependent receptor
MLDTYLHPRIRLNTGMRIEVTDMMIRSKKLDLVSDLTPQEEARLEGGLQDTDWMPSLNLTWQLGEDDVIKMTNARFAYSRTIARPVFREKSPFRGFDFETLEVLKGNPLLDGTKVDNFDIRIERYPDLGEVLSASLFYKRFTDPIEQTSVLEAVNTEYTWANVPYANVIGLELEGRKGLDFISDQLDDFTLSANLTFIRSRTAIFEEELNVIRNTDPMHPTTRPLFGQSPYIINTMLTYSNDSANFNATVAFNVQGEKLILTTNGGLPDIYQQPTPALDFLMTKQFGDHFAARFRATNLLNPINRKTYAFQDELYDWLAFTTGRNFSLTLSYRI